VPALGPNGRPSDGGMGLQRSECRCCRVDASALFLLLGCIVGVTIEQLLYRGSTDRTGLRKFGGFIAPAIVFHVLRIALWLWLLRRLPLGVALPLTGLTSVTIALAAGYIYREPVGRRRWTGIALVFAGFVMVTAYRS
jgi:undecaprenyl phosphate-alpha-L-ara4N flippase subunit ArnE